MRKSSRLTDNSNITLTLTIVAIFTGLLFTLAFSLSGTGNMIRSSEFVWMIPLTIFCALIFTGYWGLLVLVFVMRLQFLDRIRDSAYIRFENFLCMILKSLKAIVISVSGLVLLVLINVVLFASTVFSYWNFLFYALFFVLFCYLFSKEESSTRSLTVVLLLVSVMMYPLVVTMSSGAQVEFDQKQYVPGDDVSLCVYVEGLTPSKINGIWYRNSTFTSSISDGGEFGVPVCTQIKNLTISGTVPYVEVKYQYSMMGSIISSGYHRRYIPIALEI